MRKRRKKKNSNLNNFVIYTLSILSAGFFLICYLNIKNQCVKLNNDIEIIKKTTVKNISIVKELQSQRDYLLSEHYISSVIGDDMVAVVPESEIIKIDKWIINI